MGKPYSSEMDALAATFQWAASQDVKHLRLYLERWVGEYALIVGSGGSFSAAHVIANFRELRYRSPTKAVTPLEFISKLGLVPNTKALLISAEGKNADILLAARQAIYSDISTAALSLTNSSPLAQLSQDTTSIRMFAYTAPWDKDGYLATNSLLATTILIYRAIFGDIDSNSSLGSIMSKQGIDKRRKELHGLHNLRQANQRNVIILHDTPTEAFAVDLESRLHEAAITFVETVDYRQFAHGRHLQLARNRLRPIVIAVSSKEGAALARETIELLPKETSAVMLNIEGCTPQDTLVNCILTSMLVVEAIVADADCDPGRPNVPEFGRAIHKLDAGRHAPLPGYYSDKQELYANRKTDISRAPPEIICHARRAVDKYLQGLRTATFRAIVCDFDGTLCYAEQRYDGMDTRIAKEISTLIDQGLQFAVASGRGGSLQDSLRAAIAPRFHDSIIVGYYGGSVIRRLSEDMKPPEANQEFVPLLDWLKSTIFSAYHQSIDKCARGGQLTLRVASAPDAIKLRTAIRGWLSAEGKLGWRVYCSGHSVDVLDSYTTKLNVVSELSSAVQADRLAEILRIGDSGSEDGNDFELLSEGWSLSADTVSTSLETCWNFGPSGASQADATLAYLRALGKVEGGFSFTSTFWNK